MDEVNVSVNFKGGGSFTSHRPLFSEDGENVFVCWKNCVRQYSTKTGKIIHEYKGSSDRIVGFSPYNYDSYQCLVSCSEKGKVFVWKTITHYKILEQQLGVQKIQTFHVIPSDKEDGLMALVSYRRKDQIFFAEINIKEKVERQYNIKLKNKQYLVDVSGYRYFTIAHDNKIYFVPFNDFHFMRRHSIQSYRTFTCLACHPSEEVVLTGDTTGRVLVWQNIFSKDKTQAVFHWHTLPVQAVCFSTSGSYFYSGGNECVLVKWQFDDVNYKQFVPRIGAEIQHISVAKNNIFVAVATSDNAVRIFDARLYQATLIQHLVLGKQYDSGIIYDPRTKALIMNGNQGYVQFYSPNDMSLLYNVDIVGQNKITNEKDVTIQNTEVKRVAISRNGVWLATVEERKDKEYQSEIRLKFWKFDSEKQTFELNTSVEYPHENFINSMLFQPVSKSGAIRCVTVANDRKFKIWQLAEESTVDKKEVVWKCFAVGYFRQMRCCGLSFSVDGSLMATAFEKILTVWTPDSCELKCSLMHPRHRGKLKHLQFGNSNQSHLLVAASDRQLSVWNLLTLCMVWTVPVTVNILVADPLSTLMAVLNVKKEMYVFSPISSTPIYNNRSLIKKHQKVEAAAFIPSKCSSDIRMKWCERSHLYFITSQNELYCVSSDETVAEVQDDDVTDDSKSMFSMLRPAREANLTRSAVPQKHMYEKDVGHKMLKNYLEAPIHTMAPIRYGCYGILKSLIVQKESVS